MPETHSAVPGYRGTPTVEWDPLEPTDFSQAQDFLRQFYAEHPTTETAEARLRQVEAEIAATGTYRHTTAELTFGARVAWRNASRCIGRLYWNSMLVLDRRDSRTSERVFADIVEHLHVAAGNRSRVEAPPSTATPSDARKSGRRAAAKEAAKDAAKEAAKETAKEAAGPTASEECLDNQGQLRPTISVFPAAVPGRPYVRIWNEQLIRYAGYATPDGGTIGDPRYLEFTRAMTARGWSGKGDAFDVLPLAIETPTEGVRLHELPSHAILEVPLEHPEHRWFAELGLRWHAIPAISNMRLEIGGVHYPAAPFNGWYMGAEIGARNLADEDRYNMLPIVAARLGMDTTRDATLWRDRALVELNIAVLWSFEKAGIRVSDHHTEARRFLQHIAREERAGRDVPADWTWIVPPISGGTTPVFHRYYPEADLRPGFYLDSVARDLGRLGEVRVGGAAAEVEPAKCPVDHDQTAATGGAATAQRPGADQRLPVHSIRAAVPPPSVRRADSDRFDGTESGEVSAA